MSRFKAVQQYLDYELAQKRTPRLSDIVKLASKYGLKAAETRAWVLKAYPAYRQVSNKIYRQGRPHKLINIRDLGHLQADLAFLGRRDTELRQLGAHSERSTVTLVAICPLSRYLFLIPLPVKEGKSARGMEAGMKLLLEQYNAQFGRNFHTLYFDQEKSLSSHRLRNWFLENGIRIIFYKYSRTKASMAEGAIRRIRSYFATMRIEKDNFQWFKYLQEAAARPQI